MVWTGGERRGNSGTGFKWGKWKKRNEQFELGNRLREEIKEWNARSGINSKKEPNAGRRGYSFAEVKIEGVRSGIATHPTDSREKQRRYKYDRLDMAAGAERVEAESRTTEPTGGENGGDVT